jgi:hypothetical protein
MIGSQNTLMASHEFTRMPVVISEMVYEEGTKAI